VRRTVLSACFFAALLVFAGAGTARAQRERPQKEEVAEQNAELGWHLINTAIFAAGLGFAIWKLAPAFFNARTADIQKAIKDATGLKMQADFRYSEIDRKMATLPDEVKRMREQARVEMEREHERRRQETADELEHINRSIAADIAAFRAEATERIRLQTAQLALRMAERRLRDSALSSATNDQSFRDLIHLVERGKQ
jgi:F0F1-type ATP synthase membrane subunit b/b'